MFSKKVATGVSASIATDVEVDIDMDTVEIVVIAIVWILIAEELTWIWMSTTWSPLSWRLLLEPSLFSLREVSEPLKRST
jgi:hypothetical protein